MGDPGGDVDEWEAAGERIPLGAGRDADTVWCARFAALHDSGNPPLLALHGFPTCSFDWRAILPALRAERDVVVLDFPGFGLSSKPDRRYGLRYYADAAEAVAAHFGLGHADLLTHDMGDSVGGELLARDLDDGLEFTIGRRVLTNGSIYMDLAQLTIGQQLLLGLPDERNDAIGGDGGAAFARGVSLTFAEGSTVDADELAALALLAVRDGGLQLMPRTIRYLEDRLAEERRFTGAIESHPSRVDVVWGDRDPVAVVAMAHRFAEVRSDATVTVLDGVGHYPMIEAPERFGAAVLAHLSR